MRGPNGPRRGLDLKHADGFTLVGAGLVMGGVLLLNGPLVLLAAVFFWISASLFLPAVAYVVHSINGKGGRLFSKRANGTIPALWLLVYLPFVVSRYVNLLLVRRVTREPATSEVDSGILVGGRLFPWDQSALKGKAGAVLDVCAELPKDPGMDTLALPYLAVPVLDASGPTVDQLAQGVAWILQQREVGRPVLVQCTLGHGRSATFVAALLIATGQSATIDEAVQVMCSHRPWVRLNRGQRISLERALEQRAIPKVGHTCSFTLSTDP